MDPNSIKTMAAAAGAGGDNLYVEDVFSTYIYQGNSSTGRDIVNDIDLAGEGGLVWVKKRGSEAEDHVLIDTERGANKFLISNKDDDETTTGGPVTDFNSNGFEIDNNGYVNSNGSEYVSWTFRKAPGFFDVVTYTGNGTAGKTISHNLGSVPGMIIVKDRDATNWWVCYHIGMGSEKGMYLNDTAAETDNTFWNDTAPTSTEFTVGDITNVNADGHDYVAYLFANDDQQFGAGGNESIIKCGLYTGDGTAGNTIDLGFEPQWLMFKNASNGAANCDWFILDQYRNFFSAAEDVKSLEANTTSGEETAMKVNRYSSGFVVNEPENDRANASSHKYIYMAIRRPNKPPEAATEVFKVSTRNGNETSGQSVHAGFPVDMAIIRGYDVAAWTNVFDRERGPLRMLVTSEENDEAAYNHSLERFDYDMEKIIIGDDQNNLGVNRNSTTYVDYFFKRATGFFDIVCYTGTGSARTVTHNLGAVPELIIVKRRDNDEHWDVYVESLGNTKFLELDTNAGEATDPGGDYGRWDNTSPTSSVFTVDKMTTVNTNDGTYVAYLFATLPGISKVGTYNGTGNDINIDCGFTAGARFVLAKRVNDPGNWYLWDSERGIVSGDDPWLDLRDTAAQQTTDDFIDPYTGGFTITSNGTSGINASDNTYIYLAIA